MPASLRRFAVAALSALCLLPPASPAAAALGKPPEPVPPSIALTKLNALPVNPPHVTTGYSRAKFPHWTERGKSCSTREIVLHRDGQGVQRDAKCRALAGTWYSEYDGETLTAASQVDIDHMVPLANAWRSGAAAWGTAKRKDFANDLTIPQLIAVSATTNRSKGDQSPDQWKPPLRSYWCTYARAWVDVKYSYVLAVTTAEKVALTEMLGTCGTP